MDVRGCVSVVDGYVRIRQNATVTFLGKPMKQKRVRAREGTKKVQFYRTRIRYRVIHNFPACITRLGELKNLVFKSHEEKQLLEILTLKCSIYLEFLLGNGFDVSCDHHSRARVDVPGQQSRTGVQTLFVLSKNMFIKGWACKS